MSDVLGSLPAMSNDDDGPGLNTGHFVIAVTAVAANSLAVAAADPDPAIDANGAPTANILFPTLLAADMDGTGNIDNGGMLSINGMGLGPDPFEATDEMPDATDTSTKNVGDLSIANAEPIAFNHLTGHFTEAFASTGMSGADQSASWGGTPIVRPAVMDTTDNATPIATDYTTLNGMNSTGTAPETVGGRLAEKDAGGIEANALPAGAIVGSSEDNDMVDGYENEGGNMSDDGGKIQDGPRNHRALNGGALVLPALHGAGDEIMLLLSVSEDFGAPGKGEYELVPAMTGIDVKLMDGQGDVLDMKAISDPDKGVVGGGGATDAAESASMSIIVNGMQVMVDANLAKCSGTAMEGPWKLSSLTSLFPEATAGGNKFAGLDADIDPMMNRSPGWIKFARGTLICEEKRGDGDAALVESFEAPDGVPTVDTRTYTGGTLIVEEKTAPMRTFVVTGRAVLKYITPEQTFAASWTLKSPPTATVDADGAAIPETGNVGN